MIMIMSNSSPGSSNNSISAANSHQPPPPPHDLLLTPKSLELSLSPPRAPPFGSAQRALLTGNHRGRHPRQLSWTQRHYRVREEAHGDKERGEEEAHSRHHPHETLRQRLHDQLVAQRRRRGSKQGNRHHHPHLPERSADAVTRTVGLWWPVARQHRFRDGGTFRRVADSLVTASAPLLALAQPRAARRFLQLSSVRQEIRYGPHPLQGMDLFVPGNSNNSNSNSNSNSNNNSHFKSATTTAIPPPQRLVLFVHGGAWGSGKKWMYRLVAAPYLAQGWAVAIPGYRTYPDGTAVDQVADLERAAAVLQRYLPSWFDGASSTTTKVTLMGHSSGAHVALLMLVDRAREKMLRLDSPGSKNMYTDIAAANTVQPEPPERLPVDSFVGLSGPYDISHHFDYEAGRGVEELSPMKPANGHTRANFRRHSPAARLRDSVLGPCRGSQQHRLAAAMPGRLALVHGMEDDTVPFTATADAARLLRSCGVTAVDEMYVPETGHQDLVMQVMLGGPARDVTVEWIRNLDENAKQDRRIKLNAASASTKNPPPQKQRILHARSKL